MNLHEFQAKAILARHGIPVPAGQVAWTPDEVTRVAADLGGSRFAVKAQILAGGRGEAGGVKVADSFDQVREIAAEMLGSRLIRAQTFGNSPKRSGSPAALLRRQPAFWPCWRALSWRSMQA